MSLPSQSLRSSLPNILGGIFEKPSEVNKEPRAVLPNYSLSHKPAVLSTHRRSMLLSRRLFFLLFLAQDRRLNLFFSSLFIILCHSLVTIFGEDPWAMCTTKKISNQFKEELPLLYVRENTKIVICLFEVRGIVHFYIFPARQTINKGSFLEVAKWHDKICGRNNPSFGKQEDCSTFVTTRLHTSR